MTVRPKHTRRDENHAEVRDGLRDLGALVFDLSDVGGPVLDLLVCWRGKCVPVEIKPIGKEDDLTDEQRETLALLRVLGIPDIVASSVEGVIEQWDKPRWQVVDQAALKQFNAMIQDIRDEAVRLTKMSFPTPHQKKRICELRDALFAAYDLYCQAVERR